jgi:dephospho-CoA kinase
LHPVIRAAWKERVRQAGEEGLRRVVVVIPLLFETGAEREVDETICVACSAATQRERLLKRGWTAGEIEARVAAQWPVARKMDAADRVIWSEGSLDVTEEQASRILC